MITNIYDDQFEEYLVIEKGYDLDYISLKEVLEELENYNKQFI